MVKARQGRQVIRKAVHVVLGVNLRGEKEVPGLWITENEGTKYWLSVLTELKNRGVQDIFIACMDDPKGCARAIFGGTGRNKAGRSRTGMQKDCSRRNKNAPCFCKNTTPKKRGKKEILESATGGVFDKIADDFKDSAFITIR